MLSVRRTRVVLSMPGHNASTRASESHDRTHFERPYGSRVRLCDRGPTRHLSGRRWGEPDLLVLYYGDVSAIRLLLSQGERLESLGENLGLDSAAFHGHWRLSEFLLENGADANFADPNTGETALH